VVLRPPRRAAATALTQDGSTDPAGPDWLWPGASRRAAAPLLAANDATRQWERLEEIRGCEARPARKQRALVLHWGLTVDNRVMHCDFDEQSVFYPLYSTFRRLAERSDSG